MKISNRSIFVTGGAGFIGSHLVTQLLTQGNQVTVFDNFSTGSESNLPNGAAGLRIVKGDVRHREAVNQAMAGHSIVYHLATHCVRLSINQPEMNHEVNSTGTLNVLASGLSHQVERFVYCSSSEVYGNPKSTHLGLLGEDSPKRPTTLYGATKLAGEHYTLAYHQTYGLPAMVLRPFNTYGPRSHLLGPYGEVIPRFFVMMLAGEQPTIFGDGKQTRDFTFVDDTAKGLIHFSELDELMGDAINIALGEEISILDLTRKISQELGLPFNPKFLPERPGDIHRLGADISKMKRMIPQHPFQTKIESGLKTYWKWVQSQKWDYKDLAKKLTVKNWELS